MKFGFLMIIVFVVRSICYGLLIGSLKIWLQTFPFLPPFSGFLSSNQNETGFEKSSMDCSLSQEAGSEDVTGSLTTRHSGRANDESMSLCEQIETACALLGDVISTAKHLDTLMMGRQDMLSQNM